MPSIHQFPADDEAAVCGICDSVFVEPLAWCAHRPWKSVTHRYSCRWPKALRNRGGIWALKPSCREAVEIAEDGPPDEFRIQWPTPATVSTNPRSRGIRASTKSQPHNHAGCSAASDGNREGRA